MKQLSLIVSVLLFFLFSSPALAVISHQISNFERVNDYYSIDVTLSGASADSQYYLQAMFTKDSPPNYLGFTWGQKGDWIKYDSSPDKDFLVENFPVIQNDNTQKILIKPDLEDSGYKGPGEYLLKVKRYTQGGSGTYSENTLTVSLSDDAPILAVATQTETPTQTPTPTPTPTPSPTRTPTPTPTSTPTSTKTPTPTPTSSSKTTTPTSTVNISDGPTITQGTDNEIATESSLIDPDILGEATTSSTPTQTTTPEIKGKSSNSGLNRIFILLGLSLAIPAAALYFFSDRVKIS